MEIKDVFKYCHTYDQVVREFIFGLIFVAVLFTQDVDHNY